MDEMNLFSNEKKNNLIHYEGVLGVFDYDPREFEIKKFGDGTECLHYCGKGSSVDLPDGCINTSYMFSYCGLPKGFSLGEHFDTSNVIDMSSMFECCEISEGFSLGEHFDTSNVTSMEHMFSQCKLPEDLSLGEHFDTSKVTDMSDMFSYCSLSYGFSLGEHFDTSKVTNMRRMFGDCRLPEGFSLGAHFYTSNVTEMSDMFFGCVLPRGFSLGEHFDTSNVADMHDMFVYCEYGDAGIYDYFKAHNTRDIITKLRKYKKSENTVVDNELTALMLSVSEELQISTSAVQRMMKSYLKSLVNK